MFSWHFRYWPPPRLLVCVEHTIATDLRGGYQVVLADLNHDGKPDLIALASGMSELAWYENPGWQRHGLFATGQSRMINCVVIGNEIVLASEFNNEAKNSAGLVSVLRPGADPLLPWTATEIDRLPTSHRLRVADLFGDGHPVVINAALTGAKATAPDYRDQTPLVYYRPGEWKRRVISTENSGVVHGIFITDSNCILTASFTGIHRFCAGKAGDFQRTEIAKGDPRALAQIRFERYHRGTSGPLPATSRLIEPWHGNQVAICYEKIRVGARSDRRFCCWDGHHPDRRFQPQAATMKLSPASAASRTPSIYTLTMPEPNTGTVPISTKEAWGPQPAPSRT